MKAGIPVGVSIAPVIPFVTEPDMERVLEACAEAGATSASYRAQAILCCVCRGRSRHCSRTGSRRIFRIARDRVMSRVRDMRGGKDYDSDFVRRMKGEGLWADMLKQRFDKAAKRLGMNARLRGILDMSEFKRPVIEAVKGEVVPPQSAARPVLSVIERAFSRLRPDLRSRSGR